MRRSSLYTSFPLALGLTLALTLLWLLGNGAPLTRAAEFRVCTLGCSYSTIQAAVDAAGPGDIIKVAAGTYSGVLGRPTPDGYPDPPTSGLITQVIYISKTVIIQGGYISPTNWTTPDPINQPTLVDAQNEGRALLIAGNVTPTIEGLRFTNGNATSLGGFSSTVSVADTGGGVYILTATATLRNNLVFSNTAARGGGVYLQGSPSMLERNTVYSNIAPLVGGRGGGLYLYDSPAILNRNTVISNTAREYGGGIYVFMSDAAALDGNVVRANAVSVYDGGGVYLSYSGATLTNTLIADNQSAGSGSGVGVYAATPRLLHSTIANNTGGNGRGVYLTGDGSISSTVSLINTIVASHTFGIYADGANTATLTATLWSGNTTDASGPGTIITGSLNYYGDPAFVNPAAGDYHLRAGSAAIDHGVNAGVATDLDGVARPQGSLPDLGAYEAPYYTLSVALAGTGAGNVTSTPGTINCPTGLCANDYVTGTVVTLSASPSITSTFTGWSGGGCSGTSTCVVTIAANTNVTATFAAITRTLSVALAGTGTGDVTSTPGTINCPTGLCANDYVTGTVVTLSASPSFTSTFTGWGGGGCSGTGTCVVTMTADTNVTANFAAITRTLSVALAGTGAGNVTSTPGTINCPTGLCANDYVTGTVVTLSASPSITSTFTGWSGGGCSGTSTCVVTMTANTNVTATFAAITRTLSVALAGTGAGDVTSTPGTINCPTGLCANDYVTGTVVTLSASPSFTSTFTGWGGGGCSGTGTCVVTVTADTNVTATFTEIPPDTYLLYVYTAGTGSGTVTKAPDLPYYDAGTVVTLTALADTGSTFARWSGAVSGSTNPVTLTMNGNMTVTAIFDIIPYTLTINYAGNGSGSVATDFRGTLVVPPSAYTYGTVVTLTAVPSMTSSFGGWSGAVSGLTNPITLTMDGNKTVTATFNLLGPTYYTLTISYLGNGRGSVTTNPSGATFVAGTVVTLTAVPSVTSSFAGWSIGTVVTTTNPLVLTMDADKDVTATFNTYMIYLPTVKKNQ
jgi:parallel beta-helix repeat protein